MTTQEDGNVSTEIQLSDDDVAFLFSILREASRPQPLTTQQLIDALRSRASK